MRVNIIVPFIAGIIILSLIAHIYIDHKQIQTLQDQGISCVSDLVTCEGKNDK